MKKTIAALMIIAFLATPVLAADEGKDVSYRPTKCPTTIMDSDCLACHTVSDKKFILKEFAPDAWRSYPPTVAMRVIDGVGKFVLMDIDSTPVASFFAYLRRHKINKAVIEIHSPGGAVFEAQRIINIIKAFQDAGGSVETHLYGMAFSAGFYAFIAGDKRLVSPTAQLMWHEIQSFSGFAAKVSTPSDKDEEARVLRHLQDVLNSYVATRGKLSKAEIDAKVKKQEWWMTGADAVTFGFADGYVK